MKKDNKRKFVADEENRWDREVPITPIHITPVFITYFKKKWKRIYFYYQFLQAEVWSVFKMYFNIIESIRGLSCILIVIFHLNSKILANGYLGVDQFYIISGFLITYSIFHSNSKSFNIIYFLLKRVKRILPLKCIVILCITT